MIHINQLFFFFFEENQGFLVIVLFGFGWLVWFMLFVCLFCFSVLEKKKKDVLLWTGGIQGDCLLGMSGALTY